MNIGNEGRITGLLPIAKELGYQIDDILECEVSTPTKEIILI
jgi:hypothetical protein